MDSYDRMDQDHRRGGTKHKAGKRVEYSSSPKQPHQRKGDLARPSYHTTFHSEMRGHQSGSGVPSYMLQDPTNHRRYSSSDYHEGSEEMSDWGTAPSTMDTRPSPCPSRMEVESSRLQSLAANHHHHLPYGSVPASEYPSYILRGGAKSPPSIMNTQRETGDPYAALSAGAATAIAIDAETGRPVRILTHAAAAYGHPLAAGTGVGSTHAYPSASGPSSLSTLYGGGPSAELLQRQTPTLAAAAEGRNAVLVQRPGGSLPLYITDPLAPSTDLGRPPSPPQDPYSFSNNPPMGGLEELVVRRRLEEQSATALLRRQHEEIPSQNPSSRNLARDQEQRTTAYLPLIGHVPAYHHFQSHQAVQQNQQIAHRRSLPLHNGSSSSPKDDAEPDPPSVVPQDLPDPKPGQFPAILFCEADEERLTSYQCLLRKQLEIFEADMEDVRHSTRQGRTAPIKLGQVGVRCRHCAGLKVSAGTKGASYYSQTIDGIYQIAQNMSKCHLCEKCVRIPRDIRHKLNMYRTDCRRAIKGKEYWSEHVRSLGVYEDPIDGCLRVRRPGNPRRPRLQAQEAISETRINNDACAKEYTEPGEDGQSTQNDSVTLELKDDKRITLGNSGKGVTTDEDTRTDSESNATPVASHGDREGDELPRVVNADEEEDAQYVKPDSSIDNIAVVVASVGPGVDKQEHLTNPSNVEGTECKVATAVT